ncbi:MAG: histidine triad nucleotide-binding protein [Actinomycetota bacterium]
MSDCLFCQIIAGDIPGEFVVERDEVVAFRDIHPAAPTHVLVVPRQHIPDARELDSAEPGTLEQIFQVANEVAEQEGIRDSGFRLIFNAGPDSGMLVPHLHLHVVGGRPLGSIVSGSSSHEAK